MPLLDGSAPVVIGGVGGSGTRVVTDMLIAAGYHMGTDNNSAHDNLWFRFLLKRPEWFMSRLEHDRGEINQALRIFTALLTGSSKLSAKQLGFIAGVAREQKWRGVKRMLKLLRAKRLNDASIAGWGWKEPNTHIFLEVLYDFYPRMKYVHTIRHGLDMAYSQKRGQLYEWGSFFDVSPPATEADLPKSFVQFWIKANRRAIKIGKDAGPRRFFLLNFDNLCVAPRCEVGRLVEYLEAPHADIDQLASIPRAPETMGRYKQCDTSQFSADEVQAVRDLGFQVDL